MQEAVIAINGKSARHSFDGDQSMLHMVSAGQACLSVGKSGRKKQ